MESWIVLAITAGSLVAFAFELLPIDLVAVGIVVALVLTGVLEPGEAVAGFGDKAVVAVGALFVLSQGVLRTGALGFLARRLASFGRSGPGYALPIALAVVTIGSAFINNTPVVVVFLPVFLGLARRFRIFPSRVLIPLSYASILGGTCTLIGSSTNVIVSSVAEAHGLAPIGMFELTPLGVVLAAAGLVYLGLAWKQLLPERKMITTYLDPESTREFVTEVEVHPGSRLIGKAIAETPLDRPGELRVLQVIRGDEVHWPPLGEEKIREGDLLLVRGNPTAILELTSTQGIQILPEIAEGTLRFDRKRMVLSEIVISPDSRWPGRTVREVRFSRRFGVTVVGILRRGHHLHEKVARIRLRAGDVLLAFGDEGRIADLRESEEFLLMEGVQETIVNKRKAPVALGILAAVVAALASGRVPLAGAALAGAFLMVVFGCLTPKQAYGRINWPILILMGGTISLGRALEKTGLASDLAHRLVSLLLPLGPVAVVSAVYLLASLFAELLTRTAAAVLLVPIAIHAAGLVAGGGAGLAGGGAVADPRPFVLAVVFGASASFATPVGYNTNAIVYGPGGYRYIDYMKIGLPLKLLFWAIATVLIPVLWPPV